MPLDHWTERRGETFDIFIIIYEPLSEQSSDMGQYFFILFTNIWTSMTPKLNTKDLKTLFIFQLKGE